MTLVSLPTSSDGAGEGWHHPPHPMWFVLLNGEARVWTPGMNAMGQYDSGGQEVWLSADGKRRNQVLLALDILGKGHKTWYYGDTGTEVRALQVPLGEHWEDAVARWEVVKHGACE